MCCVGVQSEDAGAVKVPCEAHIKVQRHWLSTDFTHQAHDTFLPVSINVLPFYNLTFSTQTLIQHTLINVQLTVGVTEFEGSCGGVQSSVYCPLGIHIGVQGLGYAV